MKSSTKVLLAALLSAAALTTLRWLPKEETPAPIPTAKQATPLVAPPKLPAAMPAAMEEASAFADIGGLEKGGMISLPLPGGGTKQGRINYVNRYPNGACAAGGRLAEDGEIFEIAHEPWGYRGFILQKKEKIAYVYSSDAQGKLQVQQKPIGDVICEPDPNFKPQVAQNELSDPQKAAIYNGGRSVGIIGEAIPVLNSLPRAEATIYLDFDGEVIEGQSWEGGARIVATAYNLTAAEITDMWRRVAEDFAPFEVNVSTDLQAYLRAPQGRRIHCITTTNNFAAAGGVAFNNTFMESGEPCCWNFYSGNAGAVVISHEVGHTFGLSHDGTSTAGYFGGYGSGNMSWGPIMGAPYGQSICQWSKGDYPDANEHEDDLNIIAASAPRRADDHSGFATLATPLTLGSGGSVSNSGVIEGADDIDTFIFTTTAGGSLTLNFDPAQSSPNLDIEAKLYNSAGGLVATASPANQMNAVLTATLVAGTYTVTVDGVGNGTWATQGYDDYASIGQYSISGTVPTPSWRFQVAANSLNGTVAGTVAPGGSGYLITSGNTGSTFAINSTTGVLTVANAAGLISGSTFNLGIFYNASQTTTVPVKVAPLRGTKQEIWTGLGGDGIGPLTSLASYPNSPNITRYAPNLQSTYPLDNYGQKLSGYLLPVETGNFTFWTKSDDASEVWLSTDSNPANKVKICYATGSTGPDNWAAQASQQSAAIALVAGQRYYIEVLLRDQTGPDHLAVAWQTPTLSRRLITSDFLEYPGTMPNRAPWLASMTFRVREDATAGTAVGTLAAGDFEPGSVLSGFSISGGNTGTAFALNASTGALTVNGPLSFATLPKYFLDVQVTDSGGLSKTAQIAVEVEPRAVKREFWSGISGNQVSNLTSAPSYPNSPNSTTYQAFFETPSNIAENYGQRLSGYLRAPDSGSYTFWISSDDAGELWLSTDTNPANKVKIAYHTGATASREWGKYGTQKSNPITLEGGKFYYVEVLHKEGAVDDNLAVSWQGPGFGQVILGAPHVTQSFYNHGAPVLDDKTVTVSDRDTAVTTLEAKDWSDPGTTVRYSITAGNDDGAFTIDPLTGTISASGTLPRLPVGNRVLTITATDNSPTPLSDTASITVNVQKAVLKREVWTGLPDGQALTDLTGWLYFPQAPDQTGYEDRFKAPTNWGENYGQRLSGYLIPPTTGNYTFWIASDDGGQLFLSSDSSPANKKAIASVNGSVGEEQWNAQGNQQSAVIPLLAGQRYYIEALQKEGNGGDHLAVAWQGPGIAQAVIPGANLEYPDELRPTLRREIWTSTNPVAWAKSPATNLMDWATTSFAESFEGTGALSGNATETGTATWGASAAWTRNNNIANKAGTGYATALLPFTPAAGKIYTLSLEMDPTNSPSTDWFALGFLTQPSTNTALYTQGSVFETYGAPWMLVRANGNVGGNTIQAFSSALNNPVNSAPAISGAGTYDTVAITLDTRGASWVSRYYVNGSLRGSHTLSPNPSIQSVGFGAFSTAVGNVRNFRIASNDAPTATSRDYEGTLMTFKAPIDTFENFTQRLSGFIVPPATGAYTFWLATDDDGELWLSTDENPANLVKIAAVSGFVNPEAWDVNPSQKSALKNLVAGKRYYVEVRHRDGVFGDHAAVAWEGPGFTRQIVASQYLEHPSAPADRTLPRREAWTGITGNNVSDLTGNAAYPATPNSTAPLATGAGFKAGTNMADNFGERVSGFIVAPETGRFTFWIASDDASELWLSSDANIANRIKIASAGSATGELAFDVQASQKSVPVALVAGQRYYIEALHKEGVGGDYLAVAWQGPSFARRVISNQYLEHPLSIPGTPSLKREVWTGIAGEQVANLTSAAAFTAGTPNERGVLTAFEAPIDQADNYGQKICAKLIAPESGNYKFWIASDDASELWLSTNANPANRIKIAFTTAFTNPREWTKYATQESGSLPLVAGTTYYIEALQKDGASGDHLAVAWQGPSFARQIIDGRFLQFYGSLPAAPLALKREIWTGISGEQVSNLTGTASYPNSPNQTFTLEDFEAPQNWGDNYGQKISGYLIAPRAGDYKFWIASDDGGDLNLATDGNPANKTRIAYTTNATGYRNWTNNANQTSATITLTAGQRCYIEALQKEGGGDDYVSVSWQGPGFGQQILRRDFVDYPTALPITAEAPVPVVPNSLTPGYAFWLDANGLTGGNRAVNADPDGDQLPNSLEFVLGGKPIGGDGNSSALWPQATVDANFVTFVYRRADVSIPVAPFVQYGEIPGVWTTAVNGVGGVQITTEDDAFGVGIDKVTVKIPRGAKFTLFARLNVTM